MKPAMCRSPRSSRQRLVFHRRADWPLIALLAPTLAILSPASCPAQIQPGITEPKLLSIFPLGGRRGTTIRIEVRGNLLSGANNLWVDKEGLRGRLLSVEVLQEDANPKLLKANENPLTVFQASIEVEIQPTAQLGIHWLRLVTPRGISDAVPFRVLDEPVVVETANPHDSISQAQPVEFPAIINGKLSKSGELDYYSFQAKQGEILSFEVVQSQNCDPRLALYRAGGSWLNPDRPTRLLMRTELSSDLMQDHARGSYRFTQGAQYFLEVSSIFGKGTPGSTYQIRVNSVSRESMKDAGYEDPPEQSSNEWRERSFGRRLQSHWMEMIEERSVKQAEGSDSPERNVGAANSGSAAGTERKLNQDVDPHVPPTPAVDLEANDHDAAAEAVSIPTIIQGAIDHPGKVDSFKFKVNAGQKLAFEIETPDTKPPYFNPRLGVVDAQDRELFSNVERRLSMFNNNADPQVYLKTVSPKVIYGFEHGGEYTLQIRDITSRYGGASYRYKILIRPEIPHLGEVTVQDGDHINLIRSESKKLALTTAYEEGFQGDVSFFFTGLPEGVQALPAAQFDEGRPPLEVTQNPEIVAPSEQKSLTVLVAAPNAPLTSKPVMVQLHCRPIVKGKLGSDILVHEFPLMVVENLPQKNEEKSQPLK